MSYSVPAYGERQEFPKVTTGEYPFVIDEIHIVRFDDDPSDKLRVFYNLGVVKTTKGTTEEVRLAKTMKPSMFPGGTGSKGVLSPAGFYLLCRAVGLDTTNGVPEIDVLLGKTGVIPVTRGQNAEGGETNKIDNPLPLGSLAAPTDVTIKGVTDKRPAFAMAGADAGDDPNW